MKVIDGPVYGPYTDPYLNRPWCHEGCLPQLTDACRVLNVPARSGNPRQPRDLEADRVALSSQIQHCREAAEKVTVHISARFADPFHRKVKEALEAYEGEMQDLEGSLSEVTYGTVYGTVYGYLTGCFLPHRSRISTGVWLAI